MKIERKFYPVELKSGDSEALTLTAVVSTERRDRQNDIMRARGCKTDSEKIPVLFSHGMGPMASEPVGKVNRLWVDQWKNVPAVFASMQFYPDETGRRLYEKIMGGYLNSWSIGFFANFYKPLEGGGRDVTDWTLLEASAVSVPANADTTTILESASFQALQLKFMDSDPGRSKRYVFQGRECSLSELNYHIRGLVDRVIKRTVVEQFEKMRGRVR